MSPILHNLKSGVRAAAVAVALGATALVAAPAPAMAQGLSFNFDFGIAGGDNSASFELNSRGVRVRRDCLSNREIRRGLSRAGFDDIRFIDESRRRVFLIAEWEENNRDYSMNVHRCTGRVTDIEPVRRRPNSGFNLQFSF